MRWVSRDPSAIALAVSLALAACAVPVAPPAAEEDARVEGADRSADLARLASERPSGAPEGADAPPVEPDGGPDSAAFDSATAEARPEAAAARPIGPATTGTPRVYVSSAQDPRGITVYGLDVATGALRLVGAYNRQTDRTRNPNSPVLVWNASGRHLYALDSGSQRIFAFALDPMTGLLTRVNEQAAYARHLGLHPSGKWLLVAGRYGGVAVRSILADGGIGPSIASGATGEIVRCIRHDPTGSFVYVCADGNLHQFRLATDGKMQPLSPALLPGAGGGDVAFHPDLPVAYASSGATMTAYRFDGATGGLQPIQTVSHGGSQGLGVQVHPSGRFLFGLSTGVNTLVSHALDAMGRMTLVGHQTHPALRNAQAFHVEPAGGFLMVVSEAPNPSSLVVFRIDRSTGRLTPVPSTPTTVENHAAFVGTVYVN